MKRIFFFTLLTLLGFVFSSCKNEKHEISVLGESSASLNAIIEIKEEYYAHTGNRVSTSGFTFEEAMEKANVDFANGTGKYDIVMQYNFSLSSFVRNNYIFNLQELTDENDADLLELERDLFKNAWEEVGYYYQNPSKPDTNYVKVGYPFAANTLVLSYNKMLFEDIENKNAFKTKYGYELLPPATWQQLYDVAEFFTNPSKDTYGICMQGASGGWLYYEWALFAHAMGGGVMQKKHGWEGDLNTPFLLTSENTINATKFYLSFKPFNKGDFFNVDATIQTKEFLEGNVALAFIWSDYLQGAFFNSKTNQYDSRFGFVKVPGEKSPLAGGAFFINRKSNDPKNAMHFVKWLLKQENQIKMLKSGLSSPRKSVYDSPEVQYVPFVSAIKQSLETGVYMFEAGPDADLINGRITTWMQKAWKGELSAEVALENAHREIMKERKIIFSNIK